MRRLDKMGFYNALAGLASTDPHGNLDMQHLIRAELAPEGCRAEDCPNLLVSARTFCHINAEKMNGVTFLDWLSGAEGAWADYEYLLTKNAKNKAA